MTWTYVSWIKINNSNAKVYSITIYMQDSIFYKKTVKIYRVYLISTVSSRKSFTELNGLLKNVTITNTV